MKGVKSGFFAEWITNSWFQYHDWKNIAPVLLASRDSQFDLSW
jgi:hypothetical protein